MAADIQQVIIEPLENENHPSSGLLDGARSDSTDSGMSLENEPSIERSVSGSTVDSDDSPLPAVEAAVRVEQTEQTDSAPERRGPDELLPAGSKISWLRDQPVIVRMAESGPLAEEPVSIITAFRRTVAKHPDYPALASKINGQWEKTSYKEYHELVLKVAKGFIELGLEQYNGVGIIGFNSAEWFISDVASIFAGGLATGIYTTNTPDACQYVAESARCNIIVVENDSQLQKILAVWDNLPHLKAVVQYRGTPVETTRQVISWQRLLEIGEQASDAELNKRIANQAPNLCCTLIYTSGTTGNPKGVMLSHDNLTWTAKMAGQSAGVKECSEEVISYLPLSHVAAQILDIYIPILFTATVYFAQPDALKGSLGDTLKEVRPTSFLGVPRVWEKMQEKMVAVGRSSGTIKRKIAVWAKGIGLRGSYAKMNRGGMPVCWSLANTLVFKKVKEALGFDRCRLCMTAAAPIMRDTIDFFASLDIQLMEIYGMSESTGPHTLSIPSEYCLTSVGKEIQGCTTKLANADTDGNGEVCMEGRNIFMGYLNMEDKTHEALDDEGWLHSGDIGRRDQNGFLFITGRIKELIITAGGENVAPVLIEDAIKECLPCVSNCMLIGDKKKFLSALLTIKTDVDDQTGEPTTKLTRVARDFFSSHGCNISDVSQLTSQAADPKALQAIQQGIDAANKRAVSRAQVIQKWAVLLRDFTIPGGELGPTLKLRRPIVAKMYESTIESFYEEGNAE